MPQQHIYGLYIVSSADGLLYDALFGACVNHSPPENTRIQLASSFASMSHIAKELSPVKNCTGITTLEADTFTVEVRHHEKYRCTVLESPGRNNSQNQLGSVVQHDLHCTWLLQGES
jgi:hypothetical protein